jgi:hypothetical protein
LEATLQNRVLVVLSALVLMLVPLAGCASTGVHVTDAQAQSFKIGHATYDDVVRELRPPTSSTLNSDGTRIATYSYSAYATRPETFFPYIGGLIGGADTSSSAVNFAFDRNSILRSVSSSQSSQGIGQNLAAGTPSPRNAPQK